MKGRGLNPALKGGEQFSLEFFNEAFNILRPKPFYPHSTLGFGGLHNVQGPNASSDCDGQGPTPFPKCPGPIHESFPSGPEYTPVELSRWAQPEENRLPRVQG